METELEVDVQGEASIPVTDCSSCYFISTTLISDHGSSLTVMLVVLMGSLEQWCSMPPGRGHSKSHRRASLNLNCHPRADMTCNITSFIESYFCLSLISLICVSYVFIKSLASSAKCTTASWLLFS